MPLRSDPDKLRAWQNRSRRNLPRNAEIPQQSPRKAGHRASIQRAASKAKKAAGWRCEAVGLLPSLCCAGELEAHHVIPRSTAPHLVTDPANLVALCHFHHAYVTDHPAEARAVGLHGHSGDDLAAMALLRHESVPDRRLSAADGFGRPAEPDGP